MSGGAAASGPSNSCRTMPNANSPSSSPPRAANVTNPAAAGKHPRLGQQPCLPDARAALDHDKTTVAAIRRTEHGLQGSKLGLTLEHEQAERRFVAPGLRPSRPSHASLGAPESNVDSAAGPSVLRRRGRAGARSRTGSPPARSWAAAAQSMQATPTRYPPLGHGSSPGRSAPRVAQRPRLAYDQSALPAKGAVCEHPDGGRLAAGLGDVRARDPSRVTPAFADERGRGSRPHQTTGGRPDRAPNA